MIMDLLKYSSNPKNYGVSFIGLGVMFLVFIIGRDTPPVIQAIVIVIAVIFMLIGIIITLTQFRTNLQNLEDVTNTPTDRDDIEHAINQLRRNYDILRNQTIQGFAVSVIFMAIGLTVITIGSIGKVVGLDTSGINLVTIAGVITEFISGTALWIYRSNFRKLNETSDELNRTWKMLSALKKAEALPETNKARIMEDIIRNLAGLGNSPSQI